MTLPPVTPEHTFIKIDSDGGQIGHLGWINSNTVAVACRSGGPTPMHWFGAVLLLKHWPILAYNDC